ncbi:MAG: hypothetical protein JWM28_4239 [Chitinophagaceae bacterium]|nr:hypothetical protein [Chitinophagaceae bacterium]
MKVCLFLKFTTMTKEYTGTNAPFMPSIINSVLSHRGFYLFHPAETGKF